MPGRSKLTYDAALRLLTGDRKVELLDQALGAALIGAAPFTGGLTLSLLDARSDLTGWLRKLTGTAPDRIRSTTGKSHYELLEAAHTVLALSAFFEALQEVIGPGYAALELTEAEKLQAAQRSAPAANLFRSGPSGPLLPMPSATVGFAENETRIGTGFSALLSSIITFLEGLAAWHRIEPTLPPGYFARVVTRARQGYRDRFVRLAADLPEFAFWRDLDEHAATRTLVRETGQALSELRDLLGRTVVSDGQVPDVIAKLAGAAAAELDEPLGRVRSAPAGLTFPTVREGFVSPGFQWTVADDKSEPANDSWWSDQQSGDDLAGFLVRYLADPESTQRPLVILGQPGAGKTRLSEILAARLPPTAYTPVLVPLRRVDADAEPHEQIESALRVTAHERVEWGRLCRESTTTKVVILDGLDELIQATGVTQSGYLEKIDRFRREEWRAGHSVIPIITSRTLVMDRMRVPEGAVLVKLEEFTDDQVAQWVAVWNRVNSHSPEFRPLNPAVLVRHDLCRQPLLLSLLAIYAAESGPDELDSDLSSAELYKRLLDSFISRQVNDKAKGELPTTERRRLEDELRRDLAVAAFAMFNRGQQSITEAELEQDLKAFSPHHAGTERPDFGEPVGRARSAVAAFFFIHVADSDEHRQDQHRQSYEFLHATFGEYLVAEHAVRLLRDLTRFRELSRTSTYQTELDDSVLRAFLSHQPLLVQQPVIDFAQTMLTADDTLRPELHDTARELLARARRQANLNGIDTYTPTPYDPITRLAAYTVNLATLIALAAPDGTPVSTLGGPTGWPSLVRLWQAGLDEEAQLRVFDGRLSNEHGALRCLPRLSLRYAITEENAASLAGDLGTETYLATGQAIGVTPDTTFQRDLHVRLVEILSDRWPVPSLQRLTLYDEVAYRELIQFAESMPAEKVSPDSAKLLLNCLLEDGPRLPYDVITGIAGILEASAFPGSRHLMGLFSAFPYLVERCPRLFAAAAGRTHSSLNLLLALRSGQPELIRTVLSHVDEVSFEKIEVSTEMVDCLADLEPRAETAAALLRSLVPYGELAWRQLAPASLARLLAFCKEVPPEDQEGMTTALTGYLSCHGRETTADTLAALVEEVRAFAAERGSGDAVAVGVGAAEAEAVAGDGEVGGDRAGGGVEGVVEE